MKLVFLSIFPQLVPFVFFILASISAPTLTSIFLAKDNDNNTVFGIFGYCMLGDDGNYTCTSISLFTSFSHVISKSIIKSSMLDKISPSLILVPFSAGLTFLSLILNVVSIFSHLNFIWILSIIVATFSFLSSVYTCIIVFLIFYPHVTWLSWCLIPSTAINFANLIIVAIAFKLLPSPDDILNDAEDDEDNNYEDKNYFDKNSVYNNSNAITGSNLNGTFDNIPHVKDDFMNRSTFITRNDSSVSSFSTKEKDKNDFLIVSERLDTENSTSSNQSLKIPNVENPYDDNTTGKLNHLSSTTVFNGDFEDRRLSSDNENISTSADSLSSNFTSISQRPINPNYYAGVSNVPHIPANDNNMYNNGHAYYNVNTAGNGQRFQQQQQQQQQHYQQHQYNQYQNQMSSMPNQQRSAYMNKPKPYMMMGQRPAGHNLVNTNMNMGGMRNQPYTRNQISMNSRPNYQKQSFHPLNPYAPNSSNISNQRPNNDKFVPMKYRTLNNMQNLQSSGFGNYDPYSGFR